jgi:hypothetical protein
MSMTLKHESAEPKAKLFLVFITSIHRILLSISEIMQMMFPVS